jgi:hypothetical protein
LLERKGPLMRIYLIQDSENRIVGTVPFGVQEFTEIPGNGKLPDGRELSEGDVARLEIVPVPHAGQTIHEVELPKELEDLNGPDLLTALVGYEVKLAAEAKLVQRGS